MTKKDKNQRFVGFKNVIEIEKIFVLKMQRKLE
jgi:hypothetical protein